MRASLLGVTALSLAAWVGTAAVAYEGIDVVDAGSISGQITYKGAAPAPVKVSVTKDNDVCGDEKTSPKLVIGSNQGIANVVARLANIQKGKPLAAAGEVTFDQKGCEYDPHILLFPAGSTINIRNSDGILHNVRTNSEANPPFNFAQPKFKKVIEKKISKPEMPIRVQCDAHNWMQAWWVSQEHPYYAVTDASGAFKMDDVPPGDYDLELWHETLGKTRQKVSVKPGKAVKLTIEMANK